MEKNQTIMPYYGRSAIVPPNDLVLLETINKISFQAAELKKLASKDSSWEVLAEDVKLFRDVFAREDHQVERFRLELFTDAILPYVNEMTSRLHFDKARFGHLQKLIRLLSLNSNTISTKHPIALHPANTLIEFDKVITEINSQRTIWKSKLSQLLETSVKKQWQPILLDNQVALRNIGGRLIALGMVELVGRPIMMLYPIYLIIQEALNLTHQLDQNNKRLKAENILQIMKIILLFIGSMQLLGLLSAYTGLGYACLLIGVASVTISASDELTKIAAPAISPSLVKMDKLLDQLTMLEGQALQVVKGVLESKNVTSTGPSRSTTPTASSVKIEEINETNKDDEDDYVMPQQAEIDEIRNLSNSKGLRQRKK